MGRGKYGALSAKEAAKNIVNDYSKPRWSAPPKEECDPEEPPFVYPLSAHSRIVHRFRTQNNRLVDYAIQHEGLNDTRDTDPIMRIDCEHEEVHAHRYYPKPETREIIRIIYSQDDVANTMQDSYDTIFEESERNERCWREYYNK